VLSDVEITYSIDGVCGCCFYKNHQPCCLQFYNSSSKIGALGKGSHTIDFSVTTDNDGLADNDKSITVAFNDSGELIQ
jgi:hypothetical protein